MISMNRLTYTISILISFVIISCSTNEITPLDVSKELHTNKYVTIPDGCYTESFIFDSFLVLIASCDSNYFQVYNKNTLEFVRKFGIKGKSPHEFLLPLPYKTNTTSNLTDSILCFYDLNLARNQYIDFQKITKGLMPYECVSMRPIDKQLLFSNDLSFLEGNKIAGRSIDVSEGLFFIYNTKSKKKKWIDYLPHLSINERYRLLAYYGYLCSNTKSIVYASRYFDEILFYDLNGQIFKEHYFSKIKKPILSKEFSGVSDESMLYTMKIYGTHDFCYILRIARNGENFRKIRNEPSKILAFDWDGNLVNVYQYESFPSSFCVDETTRTIYCVTKGEDPNTIRIEKIPL